MSVFESRTGIDQQKTSPNSPVTVPQKVNSSTPGMQHLVENNEQLHRLNDLQQLSNTSARVMQLKALAKMADESPLIQLRSNGQVIQLASRVDWTSQQFQYNDAAGDLQTKKKREPQKAGRVGTLTPNKGGRSGSHAPRFWAALLLLFEDHRQHHCIG